MPKACEYTQYKRQLSIFVKFYYKEIRDPVLGCRKCCVYSNRLERANDLFCEFHQYSLTLNSRSLKIVAAEQPSWSFTAAPAATMSLEASGAVAEASSGGGEGSGGGDVDRWIGIAKECKYLPENDLKVRLQRDNTFF